MTKSEQETTTTEAMRNAVISMAVESWRFGRVFIMGKEGLIRIGTVTLRKVKL